MNYYIGDLHFGHANVIRHDGRPFADAAEMDREMIARWNAAVGDGDDVYVVGDFCYRSGWTADWYLKQLKGRKHLVVGNHDWRTLRNPKAVAMFASIDPLLEIEDEGRSVVLCHYPLAEWRNAMRGAWHVYGHIHNRKGSTWAFMRTRGHALNAGAAVNGYAPVTFGQLVENNIAHNAGA
ncbi:MAG: metallophosphoesterase [Kiritimatiellae bacterium]|nr:metallophosphoesterase [Kiritimatiellia bacterium]